MEPWETEVIDRGKRFTQMQSGVACKTLMYILKNPGVSVIGEKIITMMMTMRLMWSVIVPIHP